MTEIESLERRLEELEKMILGEEGIDSRKTRDFNVIESASASSDALKR